MRKRITASKQLFMILAMAFGLLNPSLLNAQNFNPAYRVDGAVVTHYEIDQMARLLTALGQPSEVAQEQATERMINYRLLKNLTARTGTVIDEAEIRSGLRTLASDGDVEALYSRFATEGVTRETVNIYGESQILINSYLDSQGIDFNVSDDEIVTRIGNIPDQTRQLIVISEMIIPYAEYGGRIPARFEVKKIRDRLASGESFSKIAREKSRSSTAANGGRLQPIPREALNPQLANIVANTRVGGVSQPIEIEGAIILVQYTGNVNQTISLPRQPRVSYTELFVPARGNLANSRKSAERIMASIDNCAEATSLLNGKDGRFDNVPVAALSSGMNLALGRMSVGAKSIFERENGTSVLYLCGRDTLVPEDVQPQVDNAMRAQAIDGKASGALAQLRNQARVVRVE